MGAGQHELAATLGVFADLEQEAADAVAGAEDLALAAFGAGQDGFGGAELDHDVAAVQAADGAGDDVADLVLILLEDLVLLDLAETLVEELLGAHGRDAAEVRDSDGAADFFADLGVGLEGGRGNGVDFLQGVGRGVADDVDGEGVELAGGGVGDDLDVLAGEDGFLDGRLDGFGDERAGFILGDILFLFEVLQVGLDVYAHGYAGGVVRKWATKKAGPSGPTLWKGD